MKYKLKKWNQKLKYEDWYIYLEEEIREVMKPGVGDAITKYKLDVYSLIKKMISKKQIPLASHGPNLDEDRAKIDTIVIHHTGDQIESEQMLSAIGLVRQYAYEYLSGDILGYKFYGMPVWSGHFKKGKQVFYPYHWVIFPNGRPVRLLKDRYIGWHAGDWGINTRSIGIALVGNFDKEIPSFRQTMSLSKLVDRYRTAYKISNIYPHDAIVTSTKCPGKKIIAHIKSLSAQ